MDNKSSGKLAVLKKGCLWVLGIGVGVVALILILYFATTTPEEREAYGAEGRAEREAEEAAQERAALAQSDAALWDYFAKFTALAGPCDAAQRRIGAALQDIGSTDRIQLARDVSAMERACSNAWLELDKIDRAGGLSADAVSQIEKIEEDCGTAFFARRQVAEKLAPIVDGDMRPSAVAAFEDDVAYSMQMTLACAVAIEPLSALESESAE